MVLWALIRAARIPHEILHVNFGLRAEESDGDEGLVRGEAREYDVVCHVRRTVVPEGPGVQARARRLRRAASEALLRERQLHRIALAHHANDQAETLLLQFSRGTGGAGLCGMRGELGVYLRPLLYAPQSAITAYAKTHRVAYREDASNASDRYARNRLRHHVVPALEVADPRALIGFQTAAEHQADLLDFARAQAHLVLAKAATGDLEDGVEVRCRNTIANTPGLATLLYFWLAERGFRSAQLITLAAWICDGQLQRRYLESADRTQEVVVTGSRIWVAHRGGRLAHPTQTWSTGRP